MIDSSVRNQKKYHIDFLIKKMALFENRKVKDIVADLCELLKVSDRKIYYLKQACKEHTSTDYTMTKEQRNIIAEYFQVTPDSLDTR